MERALSSLVLKLGLPQRSWSNGMRWSAMGLAIALTFSSVCFGLVELRGWH
jgi:hypothetical protein